MDEQFTKFRADTRRPEILPPPGSCDCQVHVFGDYARYPLRQGSAYQPPADATIEAAVRMHRTLGLSRGVIVQASSYGPDHRILFDALSGRPNYRGIAIVDDSVSDRELTKLHDAGVRGARFNFWKALNATPSPGSFERSAARIGALGWHAKVHCTIEELADLLPLLSKVKLPLALDHMAHIDPKRGIAQPGSQTLRKFLDGDNRWVMVSCGDRSSAMERRWDDVVPFVRLCIDAAPDRTIWCTDWPHVQYRKPMPNDAELLELLYRCVPEDTERRKILVDNPARLFGFTD
jgi:2-pyrone-4,6-dicarboxylate lactonase